MTTTREPRSNLDRTHKIGTEEHKAAPAPRSVRLLPLDRIDPDTNNRPIDEHDEAFTTLVDSIRVLGVLDPIQVRVESDRYRLIDGERRWRAARAADVAEVPCYIWGEAADPRDTLIAGVVLNEQRQAHRCIHVARRLREIKLKNGISGEQLASMTGLPLDRVKTYLCLFNGSEFLLEFFAKHDVPLAVAAELIRYEKATNEARARAVALRHLETPLTREELVRMRKQVGEHSGARPAAEQSDRAPRTGALARSLERAWKRDPGAAQIEIDAALRGLGFRLVPIEERDAQLDGPQSA